MADIINLRQARKNRDRMARETVAQENRARQGRNLAQKQADKAARKRDKNHLDGHRLENTFPPGSADCDLD